MEPRNEKAEAIAQARKRIEEWGAKNTKTLTDNLLPLPFPQVPQAAAEEGGGELAAHQHEKGEPARP